MIQDDRGFLWIGTANGLNFFDGNKFTVFKTGNSGLKSNLIYKIRKTREQEIMLATGFGAVLMDTRNAIMKLFTVPAVPELINTANRFRHMEYTSKDEMILGSLTGVYVMDRNGNLIDSVMSDFKISDLGVRWLHFAQGLSAFSNGDVLITTTDGYYLYEYAKKKIFSINKSENPKYRQLISLLKDRRPSYIYSINKFDQLFYIDNLAFNDSLFIVDIPKQKSVAKKLPFPAKDHIRWDSKIQFQNDSLVSITTAQNGYFLFSFDHSEINLNVISKGQALGYFPRFVLQDLFGQFWIGTETGILQAT
jgi:ligand-binding sensor domain-containing protein